MTRRRPRPSELVASALVLAALVLVACGGGEEGENGVTAAADQPVAAETADGPAPDEEAEPVAENGDAGGEDDGSAGEEETGEEPSEPGPRPSDFARRTIARPLLALYIKTGEDLLLEWWVIAAVDQIDLKTGNPNIPPRERIPGIGYSLAAAGAPYDNHAALSARAGGAYAERALKLAGRYVDTVAEQREDARETIRRLVRLDLPSLEQRAVRRVEGGRLQLAQLGKLDARHLGDRDPALARKHQRRRDRLGIEQPRREDHSAIAFLIARDQRLGIEPRDLDAVVAVVGVCCRPSDTATRLSFQASTHSSGAAVASSESRRATATTMPATSSSTAPATAAHGRPSRFAPASIGHEA